MDYIQKMLLKARVAEEERKKGVKNSAPIDVPPAPIPVIKRAEAKPRFTAQPVVKKRKNRFPPQKGRCQSRFVTFDARDLKRSIILQCIKTAGHKTGCSYINPGSEVEESQHHGQRQEQEPRDDYF